MYVCVAYDGYALREAHDCWVNHNNTIVLRFMRNSRYVILIINNNTLFC